MTQASCKECADLEREIYGVRPQKATASSWARAYCFACGIPLIGDYYLVNFEHSMF